MSTTTAQRLEALQRANGVRAERAELRKEIVEGELSVAEVLRDPPPAVVSLEVADLLKCRRGWGDKRARSLLWRLGIRETKPVGTLTRGQRNRIIDAIGEEL